MIMNIDQNRLNALAARPLQPAAARELRRDGRVFFVGGELPVNETLETMFESFCMESTDLFYLSFGEMAAFHRAAEMARQIKKNFNVRLMGRLDYPAPARITEHAYAAGVDILDIPLTVFDPLLARMRGLDNPAIHEALHSARSVFPRWSVASTLLVGEEPPDSTIAGIDALLKEEIVPLAAISGSTAGIKSDNIAAVFRHLASGWKRHGVPIKPFAPLIGFMTPLVPAEPAGMFQGLIDRFRERRSLAASDLRRHLRVTSAQDSLDSAAL